MGEIWLRIGNSAFSVAAPQARNRLLTVLDLLRSTNTFHRQLKTFCSSLSADTGKPTDDCFVMCSRSSVGGAIQMTQLLGIWQLSTACVCLFVQQWSIWWLSRGPCFLWRFSSLVLKLSPLSQLCAVWRVSPLTSWPSVILYVCH